MRRRTFWMLILIWMFFGAYLLYSSIRQAQEGALPRAWSMTVDDEPVEEKDPSDTSLFSF